MRDCIICLFMLIGLDATAQYNFAKQWDQRFGGTALDYVWAFEPTTDGGCIVGGETQSALNGDKTEASRGGTDFWVVKIDAAGNKQWDKRFGGTGYEGLTALKQTMDGGYVLTGDGGGAVNGDVTEVGRGDYDYWVVKIDATGNKQWDKRFGGTGQDIPWTINICRDGGYIVGGRSDSGIGGDKTENNRDPTHFYFDYWVVKIDSLGHKEWDKRFGGTDDDDLRSVQQTKDNGYILGGWSHSDSTGDKTEDNWDTTLHSADYWIVKIDSVGNKQWDKRFGTISDDRLYTVLERREGGYIIFGGGGGKTGDKTIEKGGFWVIKTDELGNKIWENAYLGAPYPQSMVQTNDGGYLMAGDALLIVVMDSTWDKTEPNLGDNSWIIKIDSIGHKQWDKTIFTTGADNNGHAVQTSDGCYAVANASRAGAGGYKSQAAWDSSYDYFVVKFCMGDEVGINTPKSPNGDLNSLIQVWPNPFTSDLSIALKGEDIHEASFTITNAMGQLIYKREESNLAAGYTKVLDLRYLPNGVYFVEVGTKEGCSVKQLVKE